MKQEKYCLYCKKPLLYQRSTRKFCDDNCKQLAYYKRKGILLSGNSPENLALTVKQDELSVKEISAQTENNFTVNGNTDAESIKIADSGGSEKENTVKEISVKEKDENVTVKDVPENKKAESGPEKSELSVKPSDSVKENEYQRVESKFLKRVEKYVEDTRCDSFRFLSPEGYWHMNDIPYIKWVTIRVRCLIESVIRLSNFPKIDRDTLFEVADAFEQLTKSDYFRFMPENYPNKRLVTELKDKIIGLAQENSENEGINFRLSPEKKAELIAARYNIGKFVPRIKFSELHFEKTMDGL